MNIPDIKKVVDNKIIEYENILKNEIKFIKFKEKIENRLETLTNIQTLLSEHKDVKKKETSCANCGEDLERNGLVGYCSDCM